MSAPSHPLPALTSAPSLKSLGSISSEPSRNRKRTRNVAVSVSDFDGFEHELDSNGRGAGLVANHTSSSAGSSAVSGKGIASYNVIHQYRTAGQSLDHQLPEINSPHVSHRNSVGTFRPRSKEIVDNELAMLQPPLLTTTAHVLYDRDQAGKVGLRKKVLALVTTMLHRSILQRNFTRAGRAWGMLLRAESFGHCVDLRLHCRWGLGAEILLRRTAHSVHHDTENGVALGSNEAFHCDQKPNSWFSEEKFEKIKGYYERLALQYPSRKMSPDATGPLDFYNAMFGLWIYYVQERHLVKLTEFTMSPEDMDPIQSENSDESEGALPLSAGMPRLRRSKEVHTKTLQQAREIAISLDELLMSPPYSDCARLWRLRGMVALWIGNFEVSAKVKSLVQEQA